MYADDTILLARSEEELRNKINVFKYECGKLGLIMNEKKSEIMMFGKGVEKKENINGIRVVEEMKYLGVKLRNEKNMTKGYVEEKIKKAQKLDNWIKYLLRGKMLKTVVGKSLWKGMLMPSMLHCMGAIPLKKNEIRKIDNIQMKVYRAILEMPKRTAKEYLLGEIGSSDQWGRDRESKLMLAKHIMDNTVKLKETVMERRGCGVRWLEKCEDYMKEVQLNWEQMEEMSRAEVRRRCKRTSDMEWRKRMVEKKSMRFYGKWKRRMGIGREWRSTKKDRITKMWQSDTVLTRSKTGRTEEERLCLSLIHI